MCFSFIYRLLSLCSCSHRGLWIIRDKLTQIENESWKINSDGALFPDVSGPLIPSKSSVFIGGLYVITYRHRECTSDITSHILFYFISPRLNAFSLRSSIFILLIVMSKQLENCHSITDNQIIYKVNLQSLEYQSIWLFPCPPSFLTFSNRFYWV